MFDAASCLLCLLLSGVNPEEGKSSCAWKYRDCEFGKRNGNLLFLTKTQVCLFKSIDALHRSAVTVITTVTHSAIHITHQWKIAKIWKIVLWSVCNLYCMHCMSRAPVEAAVLYFNHYQAFYWVENLSTATNSYSFDSLQSSNYSTYKLSQSHIFRTYSQNLEIDVEESYYLIET